MDVLAASDVELRQYRMRKRIALRDLEDVVHSRGDLHLISDRAHIVLPYTFRNPSEARFVTALIEHAAYSTA